MNAIALRVPVAFPPNPAIDDEFTASNGATYVWDGIVWMAVGGGGGGGIAEAPTDNRLYARRNAGWSRAALASSFISMVRFNITGTEPVRSPATLPPQYNFLLPPADLPDVAVDWICHGTGLGAFFVSNINGGDNVTAGPTGTWQMDLEYPTDSGNWFIMANISLNSVIMNAPNVLQRAGAFGNFYTRIWRYDPAAGTGIRIGLSWGGTQANNGAPLNNMTLGLQGQILALA